MCIRDSISGGTVGVRFEANSGSVVNISGGTVGNSFTAEARSEVNISGGTVGDRFTAEFRSVVNISGGALGNFSGALSGSVVNISGGTVGDAFDALSGSVVNISGGTVGDAFFAFSGSEVNLLGSEFFLDGELLDTLIFDEPFTISDRDVTLSGTLEDGSLFSFGLNSSFVGFEDFFAEDATLTVTAVPEPASAAVVALGGIALLTRRRRDAA